MCAEMETSRTFFLFPSDYPTLTRWRKDMRTASGGMQARTRTEAGGTPWLCLDISQTMLGHTEHAHHCTAKLQVFCRGGFVCSRLLPASLASLASCCSFADVQRVPNCRSGTASTFRTPCAATSCSCSRSIPVPSFRPARRSQTSSWRRREAWRREAWTIRTMHFSISRHERSR